MDMVSQFRNCLFKFAFSHNLTRTEIVLQDFSGFITHYIDEMESFYL